jgi:hypothetical protein
MDLKHGEQKTDLGGKREHHTTLPVGESDEEKIYLETGGQDKQQIHGGCQN